MGMPAKIPPRGAKGGEKKAKSPVIADNSVGSLSTIRAVYIWSWGPIVGPVDGLRSIKLDGTPLQNENGTLNYPGVKWQFRAGELNQERLTGIAEAANGQRVGVKLSAAQPYLFSVSNSAVDAVRIQFGWPVLRKQDTAGNISGTRVDYAVDVSTDGGPFVPTLQTYVDRKNVTQYERSHRIELPNGSRWAIRARRLTPDSNSDLLTDDMSVLSVAEIVDSDQEFPLTAVGCIEYDARTFGGNVAKVSGLMRGRIVRVPANYDPETRTYSTVGPGTTNGVWDGTFKTAYTNNPAWCWLDLVLDPYYGLGRRIKLNMVNRFSVYRIAQRCDEMVDDGAGGLQPRFTCNLYLQKQEQGFAVLQDIASIFHGMCYWDGSQLVLDADMPRDPDYTFTASQILKKSPIEYSATRWRDRHSQAMVSWDNPALDYATDKEPVFDDDMIVKFGIRELPVAAIGCTVLGQAIRAGNWALASEKLQTRGARWSVGAEGANIRPGMVIKLSDPMLAGRANGGRISAVAGRVVTVDRDIEMPAGARLLVNLPSGRTESRAVKSVSGRAVTVTADYSEAPQPESAWALDYDDLALMQFKVMNVTRPSWNTFDLEVFQHDPAKFPRVDSGTVVDSRPISVVPIGTQDAPARVLISQNVVIDQGIARTVMSIAWDAAPGAVGYDVEWRWGSNEWVRMPRTGGQMAEVPGVYAGDYIARVRAVNAFDVSSISTTSALTKVTGKVGLPPALSSLTAKPLVYGIALAWGFPAGAEDTQRTEFEYTQSATGQNAIKLGDFSYPVATHELHGIAPGQRLFFRGRLVDRTGNVGPWSGWVDGASSIVESEYAEYYRGQIGKTALGQDLLKEIDKIDGTGPGSVYERIQKAREDLQQQIVDLTDALAYNPAKAYALGESVRYGQRLYQAKAAVPAQTPPPNADYWVDIGQVVQAAGALAGQVDKVVTDVATIDGKVNAQASKLSALRAAWRQDDGAAELDAALGAWQTVAQIAEEAKTRATQDEAIAERVTTLDAAVGSNAANITELVRVVATDREATATRIDALKTSVEGNTVEIGRESTARSSADEALGRQIDQVKATADSAVTQAQLVSERTAWADGDKALAESVETVRASAKSAGDAAGAAKAVADQAAKGVTDNVAALQVEQKARADADSALAKTMQTVEATAGGASAAVQVTTEALAALNGQLSAMLGIKLQVNNNGQLVVAGMGLGIENTPSGMQSQLLFLADRIAFLSNLNGVATPMFTMEGGRSILNTAIIGDASISFLKIGDDIQSSNYIAGRQGWRLGRNGEFEINGAVPGGARIKITPSLIQMWYPNGDVMMRAGDW